MEELDGKIIILWFRRRLYCTQWGWSDEKLMSCPPCGLMKLRIHVREIKESNAKANDVLAVWWNYKENGKMKYAGHAVSFQGFRGVGNGRTMDIFNSGAQFPGLLARFCPRFGSDEAPPQHYMLHEHSWPLLAHPEKFFNVAYKFYRLSGTALQATLTNDGETLDCKKCLAPNSLLLPWGSECSTAVAMPFSAACLIK